MISFEILEAPPQEQVADYVRQMNHNTYMAKERHWAVNLAVNLHRIIPGNDASQLAGVGIGRPGLVLGAGPSLDPDELAQVPKSWGIIACDRALKPLLEKGVIPDYVISGDGSEKICDFYPPDKPLNLILSVFVHSKVWEGLDGRSYTYWFVPWVDNPFTEQRSITRWVENMTNKSIIFAYGCTGGFAMHMAKAMGFNPLILHGMDFSYGPVDKPQGMQYGEGTGIKYYRVKNPLGYEVLTDEVMYCYRNIMLQALEVIAPADLKIIVASKYSILFGSPKIETIREKLLLLIQG